MDLRLTLLLIFVCSHGVTNAVVAEVPPVPLVPLIPLMPSIPIEKSENETDVPDATTVAPTVNPSEDEQDEGCMSIGRSQESKEAIAAAIQNLGLQLLQNLETTPAEPNIIISPLSISLALSQLALGAVNETEQLLMQHLHGNTLPCYHHALRHVLLGLRSNDLKIATRIFLRHGFMPKQMFVNESQRLYDSEAAELESVEQVNSWVEEATQGKMTQFLSALPPNLLILLINAVHFKGEWTARFDPRLTARGMFHIDDKHMVDVEMMEDAKHPLSLFIHNGLEAQKTKDHILHWLLSRTKARRENPWFLAHRYTGAAGLLLPHVVARFPFTKSMSLLVAMPLYSQVNVSSLYPKINISDLYRRLPKERAVQVKIPKFKLDYDKELQDVLTKLGLGELFSAPNLADMADGPLLVSSIKHKSNMEINEEGAEAAAATTVVISRASNPIFHLTRPFFFALVDDVTHAPIFMGVINNPSPGAPVLEKAQQGSKDKVSFPIDKYSDASFGGPPK